MIIGYQLLLCSCSSGCIVRRLGIEDIVGMMRYICLAIFLDGSRVLQLQMLQTERKIGIFFVRDGVVVIVEVEVGQMVVCVVAVVCRVVCCHFSRRANRAQFVAHEVEFRKHHLFFLFFFLFLLKCVYVRVVLMLLVLRFTVCVSVVVVV